MAQGRVFTFDSGVRIEIMCLTFIPIDKKRWLATMTRPGGNVSWNLSRGSTPRDAIKNLRKEIARNTTLKMVGTFSPRLNKLASLVKVTDEMLEDAETFKIFMEKKKL